MLPGMESESEMDETASAPVAVEGGAAPPLETPAPEVQDGSGEAGGERGELH